MDIKKILAACDHTLLSQTAIWEDIQAVIDDGIKYGTASVCIPPSFVRRAAGYADGRIKICTVIGFPNGYSTTRTKRFETEDAIRAGADEIDMVVNIGEVKAHHFDAVTDEIRILKSACGDKVLKVIIETCLLTDEEKIAMCRAVTEAGADFIKTSTGFSKEGATREAVRLMRENVGKNVKVKAAGGISTLKDAEDFIILGADRLGTSRVVKLAMASDDSQNGNSY